MTIIIAHNRIPIIARRFTKVPISLFSWVGSSLRESSAFPIFPISVFRAVAVTFTNPFPWTIIDPEYTNGRSSPPGMSIISPSIHSLFLTGTDSPVKRDSSASKLLLFRTRASAGTLSPSCKITVSPLTTSFPGILIVSPSRITSALGLARSFSASRAFSVFFS